MTFAYEFWPMPAERTPETFGLWIGERCAACGRPTPSLVEDHCHVTGVYRGPLCRSCNTLEGRDSLPSLWNLWRARPPAVVFGIATRWANSERDPWPCDEPWLGELTARLTDLGYDLKERAA